MRDDWDLNNLGNFKMTFPNHNSGAKQLKYEAFLQKAQAIWGEGAKPNAS